MKSHGAKERHKYTKKWKINVQYSQNTSTVNKKTVLTGLPLKWCYSQWNKDIIIYFFFFFRTILLIKSVRLNTSSSHLPDLKQVFQTPNWVQPQTEFILSYCHVSVWRIKDIRAAISSNCLFRSVPHSISVFIPFNTVCGPFLFVSKGQWVGSLIPDCAYPLQFLVKMNAVWCSTFCMCGPNTTQLSLSETNMLIMFEKSSNCQHPC